MKGKLGYNDFIDHVREAVLEHYKGGASVEVKRVIKNNNVVLDGMLIMENGVNCTPTIYLNKPFELYIKGKSMGDTVRDVIDMYESNRSARSFETDAFSGFDGVKPLLGCRLVNFEKNRALLETVPYIPFLDLAIVYMCVLKKTPFGNASLLIDNKLLGKWGIAEADLKAAASVNAPKILRAGIRTMEDILGGGLPEGGMPMYVLTNEAGLYGASVICYESFMREVAERFKGDLIILPSSVHEVIVIPRDAIPGHGFYDKDGLRNMVMEVNSTVVEREEVLSDNIYLYKKDEGKIIVM